MKHIPLFKVFMSPYAKDKVAEVLDSGFVGQGPIVEKFESALKDKFNVDYLATTNSATSAEHLTFHLLKKYGLKEGDEVLVTSQTCTATTFPVLANNLRIKWVDIDPKNFNVDMDDLERKISPTTKVIYLVHWSGIPNNLSRIMRIKQKTYEKFGFFPWVVQDCAHAWGAKYNGQLIGTFGDINTFSLQAIKHVTSVDGGFMTCPAWEDFYKQFKLLRWYGISREERRTDFRCELPIKDWGFKFHMADLNAAIGLANLEYADAIVERHRSNAYFYDKELKDVGGVTLLERSPHSEPSFWIYSLMVEDRPSFMKMMAEKGIATSQVHERNDKHPCVKEFQAHLPNLDKYLPKLVHIPVHWGVSEEDRAFIAETVKSGW